MNDLIEAVKDYASLKYDAGWDVVVETMSDDDIAEVIKGSTTVMGAKRAMSRHIGPRNEYAAEIRATAF